MESRDPLPQEPHAQRARAIVAPMRYDGVGTALRAAYDAKASVVPDEFKALLDRLS